jgi:hypothetical protein
MDALEEQSSLSALQGICARGKEEQLHFSQRFESEIIRLHELAEKSAARLLLSNRNFCESCTLFENGGSYTTEEVDFAGEILSKVNDKILQTKEKQKVEIQNLYDTKSNSTSFAKFQEKYAEALESLAMKNGLGRKYGAPRRNLQTNIRSLFGKAEEQQVSISALMKRLKAVEEAVDEVSVVLCIENVCEALQERAHFLDVLVAKDDEDENDAHNFMTSLNFMCAAFEKDTIALNKNEDDEDGGDAPVDMPPKLEKYLKSKKKECTQYLEEAVVGFRKLVDDVFHTFIPISAVVFKLIAQKCNDQRTLASDTLMQKFENEMQTHRREARKYSTTTP